MMNREFSISFEEIGQRRYIEGSTYAIADQIKSAGGRWDPHREAWWIDKGDVDAFIERIGQVDKTPHEYRPEVPEVEI
jgi:hypothetical protein